MNSNRRTNQKFQQGDLVLVAADAPWIYQGGKVVAYQTGAGENAVVLGSYYDQFGGGKAERSQYSLLFEKHGMVSWYDEEDLTLTEPGRFDLYEKWSPDDEEDYD